MGRVRRPSAHLTWTALILCAVLWLASCRAHSTPPTAADQAGQATSTAAPATARVVPVTGSSSVAKPGPSRQPRIAGPLLHAAPGGDGDSWKDTSGREYRLGLVNTPEHDECYGAVATAKRQEMTADGFRAQVYATDVHGRHVAVVFTARGVNLNVWLARHGYANDRYLAEFRHENPALARQLDVAFAAAKREGVGLWGACTSTGTQSFVGSGSGGRCHPAYVSPCVPIKGDGSGNGAANDLDCSDIRQKVTLRQPGVDPYRLDSDGDGIGCDSY